MISATLKDAADVLAIAFENGWSGEPSPIAFDNITFDPDSDSSRDVGYIEFNFAPGESRPGNIGSSVSGSLWRQPGSVFISVFAPLGVGRDEGLRRAGLVMDVMSAKTLTLAGSPTGVKISGPVPSVLGRSGDWFQVEVEVPFFYDYFKT